MPRFNKDKYITEGSYPSDLNDPVVMSKDRKTHVVISNFLGVDWDDEITVMPGKEGEWYTPYGENVGPDEDRKYIPSKERRWMQYDERPLSYLIEGTGPDGEEILFLRNKPRNP